MPRYAICPGFPRYGISALYNLIIHNTEVCMSFYKEDSRIYLEERNRLI